MSVTSANINDLAAFVTGTQNRTDRLVTSLTTTVNKANVVMPACGGSQFPSTPSLAALNELVAAWQENGAFVKVVHDDLVAANQFDGNGLATVSDAVIDATLQEKGLDEGPDLVDVQAVEMYGQPPYSGFVDDPICLANGNFLLRDGDVELFGVAAALSVVRTYNSRDQRAGAFGVGWSSLLDVGLAVDDRRVTFRGPDGAGAVFQPRADGTWEGNRRRRLSLAPGPDAWTVREGHDRTWSFDADGTLIGFTAAGADVAVLRQAGAVRFDDRTSDRWVRFLLDRAEGPVSEVETSDGRVVRYEHDADGRLVAVRRDRGDVTYEHDDHGFVAGVIDADGVVACRNTYDATGRVLTQVESHGRETRYEYRTDGVATVTASDGAPPNVMVHDRRGRLTAMIDGLGNTMRLTYDDDDNIVQVVERTGAVTRYAHDERGNLVERTDPDGLTERYEWDELDRLAAQTDRSGATATFSYEGDQRVPTRVLQADGTEVHATYNHLGLVTSVVDADGVSAQVERNRDGLVEAVVDGLGARVAFEYDAAGRSVRVDTPDAVSATAMLDQAGRVLALRTADGEQRFDYSAAGRMVGGHDTAGLSWAATLDEAGDPVVLSDSEGTLLAFERDTVGRVTATVAADGVRAGFELDPVGRVVTTIDSAGHRTELSYDPEGRPVLVTDPTGRTWSRDLDVLGRTTMAAAPDGGTSIRSYHPGGQLASVTDAAGHQWSYDVDLMGRVVAATDPLGATTTYRYSPGGRLTEVHSPLGRVLRREYDGAGRLARIVEPDGSETVVERRADGAVSRLLRDGVPTSVDYDDAGRGTAIAGPWGALQAQHDAGRLSTLSGHGGGTARFEHDPRGLLQRVVDPAGVVTEFVHDECGRLLAQTTAGATASFGWDGAGRLASVTDPYGQETTFGRDARGVIDRIARPDGSTTLRTFGAGGRLAGAYESDGTELLAVHRDDNGEVVGAVAGDARLRLRRDETGRVTEVGTTAGTVTYTWDADGMLVALADDAGHRTILERADDGRLEGFSLADGRRIDLPGDVELERDEAGRIVVDEHGRRFGYDGAGRLAEADVAGTTTTYGYDDRGLLATERSAGGVRTYRYGEAGELTTVGHEDGTETRVEHDATGRRTVEAGRDGGRVTYGWDVLGRLTDVVRTSADGTTHHDRIEHDPIGRPARVNGVPVLWDSAATGSLLGIGDERYLWWGNRVLVASEPDARWDRRVDGDPWGDDGGSGVRLGYRGELALDNLLFLGSRVYDTRTRSFLSRDPLPSVPGALAFAGAYAYAWCDPVNLVDPSGRRPLSDDEYAAFREQASKGIFRRAAEAVAEDPWGYLAKAAIVVGGAIVMGVAIATLGPVGVILAGAAVGALSGGLSTAIDGGDWGDIGRSALIGGVFGAAAGGLAYIPGSTAATLGQRALTNAGISALQEYPLAAGQEAADSYLWGGDGRMDWDKALLDGTMGTVGGTIGEEVEFQLDVGPSIDDGVRSAFAGDPPTSLPSPVRNDWAIGTASQADLENVQGIGPVLANRILEARSANGGVLSAQQLDAIPGIGPARLEALKAAGAL